MGSVLRRQLPCRSDDLRPLGHGDRHGDGTGSVNTTHLLVARATLASLTRRWTHSLSSRWAMAPRTCCTARSSRVSCAGRPSRWLTSARLRHLAADPLCEGLDQICAINVHTSRRYPAPHGPYPSIARERRRCHVADLNPRVWSLARHTHAKVTKRDRGSDTFVRERVDATRQRPNAQGVGAMALPGRSPSGCRADWKRRMPASQRSRSVALR